MDHGGTWRKDTPRFHPNTPDMVVPNVDHVAMAVAELLTACNVDWADENFTQTPERVAKAFTNTWLAGYGQKSKDFFTVFPNTAGENGLVVIGRIKFYSMCSHHMAPFMGYADVAYVPREKVVGLSKIPRLVHMFARRFQLQEQLTSQIADEMCEMLKPLGVMVVLRNVEHTCMTSRGVQAHESVTTTSAIRGRFVDEAPLRSEALALMRG